jgi:hypothetical protein
LTISPLLDNDQAQNTKSTQTKMLEYAVKLATKESLLTDQEGTDITNMWGSIEVISKLGVNQIWNWSL